MSNKEHRLGVSDVNLVVRHLKLEPVEQNQIQALITEINRLYGMDAISFDEKSHVLNLAYDASRLCLDGIEDLFKQHDVEVSHDWWTHFKEGHYRFVDKNIKDNAHSEPWSCHQQKSAKHSKR